MYQPFSFEVNVVLSVPFPHPALSSQTPDGGPPAGTALLSTSRCRSGLDRHDLVSLRDQFLETRVLATLDMRHSFSLEIHSSWRFTVCFRRHPVNADTDCHRIPS